PVQIGAMALNVGLTAEFTAEGNRFPKSGWLIWPDALAANPAIQKATHCQRIIADHLCIHTKARTARKQPVVGIALQDSRRGDGRLAVSGRRDHELEESFKVPGGGDW